MKSKIWSWALYMKHTVYVRKYHMAVFLSKCRATGSYCLTGGGLSRIYTRQLCRPIFEILQANSSKIAPQCNDFFDLKNLWTFYRFWPDSCFDFAWKFWKSVLSNKIGVCESGFRCQLNKPFFVKGHDQIVRKISNMKNNWIKEEF